jgi:trehalose synthase-fused probable maltokinase
MASSPHSTPAAQLALAASITTWLPQARWFAAKGNAQVEIRICDLAVLPDREVALVLVDAEASPPATAIPAASYFVPVEMASGRDAAAADPGADWLVRTIAEGSALSARAGSFIGRPLAGAGRIDLTSPLHGRQLGGDASNTSLVVTAAGHLAGAAGGVILKLLRRCRPGIQPEVEVGRFFATESPWKGTPELLGWLEYEPAAAAAEPTTLATLHTFHAGYESGWECLLEQMASGGLSGASRERILRIVATLGAETAAMHRALVASTGNPAFTPEPATPASRQAELAAMAAHARTVCQLAERQAESMPEGIARRLRRLAASAERLVAGLAGRPSQESFVENIRVHGDYHLGQVLVRPHDERVLVIDFEGEPGRELEQRRAKTSAAKDVAGMCRSFDYLVRVAAQQSVVPANPADTALLEATFLTAYQAKAGEAEWWPADSAAALALLATYKLDKLLYELAYELHNRPDWVEVPLTALEDHLR